MTFSNKQLQDRADLIAFGGDLNSLPHTILDEPTVLDLASNFTLAVSKWILSGFPVSSDDLYKQRRSICDACEYWNPEAREGLGKCTHKKCGCSSFKAWLKTEKCPIGKWPE